jgi:hypothetical protein
VTCPRPVPLALQSDAATTGTPRELPVPEAVILEVVRSGKSRTMYTIEVCGDAPPTVGHVERSTGFADLDRFLDQHLADLRLELPASTCATTTVILSFDRACDYPQDSM